MIQLPPDFKEFLALLNAHDVQYLVVGGYAVNYYGFNRQNRIEAQSESRQGRHISSSHPHYFRSTVGTEYFCKQSKIHASKILFRPYGACTFR